MKKLTFFLLCFFLISSNSTSNNDLSYDIAIWKVEKIEKDVNRKSWFWNDWDYDMILNHTYSFKNSKRKAFLLWWWAMAPWSMRYNSFLSNW